MKANELTISDWVNFLIDIEGGDTDYDPKVAQYQPMKIASLSFWGSNDGEVESAEGVINDIGQVEPIPLTAEILEENGWRKIGRRTYMDEQKCVLANYHDKWQISYGDIDDYTNIPNIRYVHQLQHALRLCNIEKEIEL